MLGVEQISIEKLSHVVGVSQAQLYRKVKSLTGISPNAFIHELRLRNSLRLVNRDFGNVAQIAFASGFNRALRLSFRECDSELYGWNRLFSGHGGPGPHNKRPRFLPVTSANTRRHEHYHEFIKSNLLRANRLSRRHEQLLLESCSEHRGRDRAAPGDLSPQGFASLNGNEACL